MNVTIVDSNWDPIDITDYVIYFTVKELNDSSLDDENAVIQLDVTEFVTPSEWTAIISVSHTITKEITPKIYKYDIKAETDEWIIYTVISWNIDFTDDVTKRA